MKQMRIMLTATLVMTVCITAKVQEASFYFTSDGGKCINKQLKTGDIKNVL
jgi:predicted peroxiredoxin